LLFTSNAHDGLIWLLVQKVTYVANKPGYQWNVFSNEKISNDANNNDFTYTTQFTVDSPVLLAGNTIYC
jgi:hypothetical protein